MVSRKEKQATRKTKTWATRKDLLKLARKHNAKAKRKHVITNVYKMKSTQILTKLKYVNGHKVKYVNSKDLTVLNLKWMSRQKMINISKGNKFEIKNYRVGNKYKTVDGIRTQFIIDMKAKHGVKGFKIEILDRYRRRNYGRKKRTPKPKAKTAPKTKPKTKTAPKLKPKAKPEVKITKIKLEKPKTMKQQQKEDKPFFKDLKVPKKMKVITNVKEILNYLTLFKSKFSETPYIYPKNYVLFNSAKMLNHFKTMESAAYEKFEEDFYDKTKMTIEAENIAEDIKYHNKTVRKFHKLLMNPPLHLDNSKSLAQNLKLMKSDVDALITESNKLVGKKNIRKQYLAIRKKYKDMKDYYMFVGNYIVHNDRFLSPDMFYVNLFPQHRNMK